MELSVSAASSLANAFPEIGKLFEAEHPGMRLVFNFAASGNLVQQIAKGAPVDVFASADQDSMQAAQAQNLVKAPRNFTQNRLVVIVPKSSKILPKNIADLQQESIQRIAYGLPASVPAGRYAQHAMQQAKLWPALQAKLVSAYSVRQALDYVARAEVDAGFVYASDAQIMPDKVQVAFACTLPEKIFYPIASVASSPKSKAAQQFISFLMQPAAQAVLAKYGFLPVAE
ncbi:MAG: molybdate ABC transporter substrate-binding protein [Burkholderiales bacterium]|nr:molybdate ABC transporter substrate-binding protein [Burkholderiales bacterium]